MNATLVLDAEETRAIVREELAKIVHDEALWLSPKRAFVRTGFSRNTFYARAKRFGLPKHRESENAPVRYWAPDVDAMMLAHMQFPRGKVLIDFPSRALADRLGSLTKGAA